MSSRHSAILILITTAAGMLSSLLRCAAALWRCPTGPFFLTIAGPGEAFPDLNDPAKLQAVRTAVKGALNLDSSYPLSNIEVWIEGRQEVPVAAATRHLLADDMVVVLVLGYSLAKSDLLPPAAELKSRTEATTLTAQIATKLADAGFVTPEQLGLLSVIVTTVNKIAEVIQVIQGITGGNSTIVLMPIGRPHTRHHSTEAQLSQP